MDYESDGMDYKLDGRRDGLRSPGFSPLPDPPWLHELDDGMDYESEMVPPHGPSPTQQILTARPLPDADPQSLPDAGMGFETVWVQWLWVAGRGPNDEFERRKKAKSNWVQCLRRSGLATGFAWLEVEEGEE